ncbi:MAG: UvrD-helicase domain-containing protein [Clostridia bacterium]|nr:UvrD-helicase domain-containing protein [Clostridia bacterium]
MGERKWTPMQSAAINERRKTLLVSAAAGSGKTATLTERIIRSLTDTERPTNIESLLVVTFTTAAAAELKAKLTAALEKAVAKDPSNKHLSHQLYMLPSAKIRTIDSFCNDILRMGADRVGLSGGYRIADGAECELLAISVLDGMLGAIYRNELCDVASAEEMEELADCLTDSRHTEELSLVLRLVYERCESSEKGVDSLLPLIDLYNTEGFSGVEKTRHGSYLLEITDEMLRHYSDICEKYAKKLSCGSDSERKYGDMAESDRVVISAILREKTYVDKKNALMGLSFKTKPSSRTLTEISADMESYSALRDMMREDVKKLYDYYVYTEDEWRDTMDRLRSLLYVLYRFEKKFDTLFLEEKIRRRALSYSDIERLCYRCLIEDGKRTDIAENLSKQYEAIYIDEYQDVNSLQNSIFGAISRPDNRFMVGDIKQSIYGFRSARPEIFAQMKSAFPEISVSKGECASIFMSDNFRSDAGVIDFVNSVFDRVFGLIGDSIGYEEGDRLRCSKVYDGETPPYRYPELCLTDKKEKGEDTDPSPDVVAAKIEELLRLGVLNSGEPVRPSDIAIILRSARGRDSLYADALKKRGIPSRISGSKSFFLSSEVLLALCLLNVIDNPRRDIYLAGLLCSPLFDFTADDLCLIRHGGGGETLYADLVSYVEANPDFTKGARFVNRLEYYRTISEGIGVDTLIAKLYRETGLMALAAKNGGADNLSLLYDYARNYESGAYKGLYNFIKFINGVLDKKTSFDDKRESAESDAVQIITSHSSKGLEYPVVFIVDAGKAFSAQDARSRLVYSSDMGISFRLRSPSGLAIVNSPIHDLTCHYILRLGQEEELRVLYVALTRAREMLYIVGSPTSEREDYVAKMELLREHLTPYALRSRRSSMEIILSATNIAPLDPSDFAHGYVPRDDENEYKQDSDEEFEIISESIDTSLSDELTRRFTFEYPKKYMTVLPEKLSVSRTYPGALDVDGALELFTEDDKPTQPSFITGRATEESAKRGIATHMFLQFCDLEHLRDGGAKDELHRLVSEGFLSETDGDRVRLSEIESFRRSRLFGDMLTAKRVYRELRFNVAMPASMFTENEEQRSAYADKTVLVQGVIDCIVEYADGSLGLYDYKTDRLSAEELFDRRRAAATLAAKHSQQLSYYKYAVERMFGIAPTRVEVYSLPLGDTVPV